MRNQFLLHILPSSTSCALRFLTPEAVLTSSTRNLATKKRKMPTKLTSEERSSDLALVLKNGWAMDESGRDAIQKKFSFKDFNEAFGFMTRVAIKGFLKHFESLSTLRVDNSSAYLQFWN